MSGLCEDRNRSCTEDSDGLDRGSIRGHCAMRAPWFACNYACSFEAVVRSRRFEKLGRPRKTCFILYTIARAFMGHGWRCTLEDLICKATWYIPSFALD